MRQVHVRWMWLAGMIAGLGAMTVGGQAPGTAVPDEAAATKPGATWVQVTPTPGSRVLVGSPAMEAMFWRGMRLVRCGFYTVIVCHVLLAVWVFVDIRKRQNRHWLFVVLTLLAGFCAAAVYALVRIGDRPA